MAKTDSPWPKHVCVLDIETSKTDFHVKANSTLAIAGIKSFVLLKGKYKPTGFRAYRSNELGELESYLNAFDGPIIGYNIFDFDYAVLEGVMDLRRIISKTVDVFHILREVNKLGMRGLKLGVLAKLNCGSAKTDLGAQVAELWNNGKEDLVIKYNENDCDITLQVWRHAVMTRRVIGQFKESPAFALKLSTRHRDQLLNLKPTLNYKAWQRRPRSLTMEYLIGATLSDMMVNETEYVLDYCDRCDETHLFENRIVRGFSDHQVFRCGKCRRTMSEHRSDGGYRSIARFPGMLSDIGTIPPIEEGFDINEDVIKAIVRHIKATRRQWDLHSVMSIDLELGLVREEDLCDICGRHHHTAMRFDNPLDEQSAICLDCLTAQRWRLKAAPVVTQRPRMRNPSRQPA